MVPSNPNPYELVTTREGGLRFILSDDSNYDFNVEVGRCGLVGFVKAVSHCGCLGCCYGKAKYVLF